MPAQLPSLARVLAAVVAAAPAASGAPCPDGRGACQAPNRIGLARGHLALVQTRGSLSVLAPGAGAGGASGTAAPRGLDAFDADFVTDADNPLDAGYFTAAGGIGNAANSTARGNASGGTFTSGGNFTLGGDATNGTVANDTSGAAGSGTGANGTGTNATAAPGSAAYGTAANGTAANGTKANATGANATSANGTGTYGTTFNSTAAGSIVAANGTINDGTTANSTGRTCVTRADPRASALGYATAKAGTPCIFGLDDRDEGSHCVLDEGRYGSLGWCWTSASLNEWGSCNDGCPLFGQAKVLGSEINALARELEVLRRAAAAATAAAAVKATARGDGATRQPFHLGMPPHAAWHPPSSPQEAQSGRCAADAAALCS
eukprot:CAMPEP_0204577310 /NCGR_PEP_ID=MMETSP0661-20131031/42272_1 /ASSEMBLY_ACC=CAM_ASM_000606 /TAXON_ID=109239 /ORGANISM="Alexandrium margalefi, Strain AMGDE01CS-322" /LENGTH=376 /DNA_ID=CAMNT_0051586133 /DNA_START=75 /DNA_END=1202 /DNA_ORIENTATION=+